MSASPSTVHSGTCFCHSVELQAEGEPFAMGYCHCDDCRHWSAGPVNAFTLWRRDTVRVTKGADRLGTYLKTDASHRMYCTMCGGHVMTDHPGGDFTDVYAAILPTVPFKPEVHVHYAHSVLPIHDGLPKYRDVPAEMGGSGEMMAE